MNPDTPTEGQTSNHQDSSSWLQALLLGGVQAYTTIQTAKQTTAQQKLQAQLAVPSVAQATPRSLISGVSNNTLILAGGAVVVGLVLVLALKK